MATFLVFVILIWRISGGNRKRLQADGDVIHAECFSSSEIRNLRSAPTQLDVVCKTPHLNKTSWRRRIKSAQRRCRLSSRWRCDVLGITVVIGVWRYHHHCFSDTINSTSMILPAIHVAAHICGTADEHVYSPTSGVASSEISPKFILNFPESC